MPQMHVDAVRAARILEKLSPGDTKTCDELQTELRLDCGTNSEGKQRIRVAIRHLEREKQKTFSWDRDGKVLTCLDASGALKKAMSLNKGVHRKSKKTQLITVCLDDNKLSDDEKRSLAIVQAQSSVAERVTGRESTKALLSNGSVGKLLVPDVKKLIEMMRT